jgi:hypothetical protein
MAVEGGEPRLGPAGRAFRTRKYGSRPDPIPPLLPNCVLKGQWSQFFADLDEMGDGEVERLEIAGGLPILGSMEVSIQDLK